jgi:prepilin-type N-terminal cleavage/methylation domain-containing protein
MGRVRSRAHDEGFTLIEVLVSIAIIGTVMASVTAFFVACTRLNQRQGQQQAAAQVALGAMEDARRFKGPALLAGRAKCDTTCPGPALTGASAYLSDTERWDLGVTDVVPSLPLPTLNTKVTPPRPPAVVTLDEIDYTQHLYVGKCWQPVGGGACDLTATNTVGFVRVVVAVTWAGQECPAGLCSQVTSTLFSAVTAEPLFTA